MLAWIRGHPSTPSSWYLSLHAEPLAVFSVCLHQALHLLHTNRAFRNANCPAVTLFINSLLTAVSGRIRALVRSKIAGLKEQGHTVGGNDAIISLSLEWKGLLCFGSEGQIFSRQLPQSYSCRVFTHINSNYHHQIAVNTWNNMHHPASTELSSAQLSLCSFYNCNQNQTQPPPPHILHGSRSLGQVWLVLA